jgi:hypothetical protein
VNERTKCEFFLIRYVPNLVRNEFINIGVLLREAAGGSGQQPMLRFTRDWARVRCLDPDADTAMLEAMESELRVRLVESEQAGVEPVLELIEDSFSTLVQITDSKGCLAESMIAEVESLMRVYVDPQKRQGTGKRTGRAAIQATMRTQFERSRVWDLMQKRVPASLYTKAGDPLRIDCAYRPNGVIRMFHAVSLASDVELAKVLSFSMPAIREGVARVEGATLQMTAVVEPLAEVRGSDEDEDALAQYRFAVETMEAQEIRVMTSKDLPRIAETAQRELRVV